MNDLEGTTPAPSAPPYPQPGWFEQIPDWHEIALTSGLALAVLLLGLLGGRLLLSYGRSITSPWGASHGRLAAGLLSLLAAICCGSVLYGRLETYAAALNMSVGVFLAVLVVLVAGQGPGRARRR